MEITCNRCHQTVQAGASFCPFCGLPQLVYTADISASDAGQPVRWNEAVRDASTVAWKPALRWAIPLAIPAGLMGAFLGVMGLLLAAVSGAWAVSVYVRRQQPARITIGAGARIGLAFGIIAGWLAFAASGGALYFERYALHQGAQIDSAWKQFVDLDTQVSQKLSSWMTENEAVQAQQVQSQTAFLLSPEGHAGMVIANAAWLSFLMTMFAMVGGALSARMQIRRRRPQA